MKKMFFIIIYLCIFCISCETPKFIKEKLSKTQFNESIAIQELSRPKNPNQIPFTLHSPYNYGCPVIKLDYQGKELFFLVDTGCTYSWINRTGIEKIFGSFDEFLNMNLDSYIEWIKTDSPNKIIDKTKNEIKKMYASQLEKMEVLTTNFFYFDLFYGNFFYKPGNKKIDGIIGQDFLTNKKNVSFDFINNIIYFNNDRLDGVSIPLFMGEANTPYIEFYYQDKKEIGLLDTGNYTFTPRSNFGKDNIHYDFKNKKEFNIDYNGKVKKRFPLLLSFNDIQIGNIEYNDIKGVYSNILFSSYNKGAQTLLQYVNGLGCEFFKNHIIQFDWENNEFIIK